jgi:hypothetical protein
MDKIRGIQVTEGKVFNKPLKVVTNKSWKRQNDVGVLVAVPDNAVVEFKHLEVYDTGLPIKHVSGNLRINTLIAIDFTADLLNSAGNLFIDQLIVEIDAYKMTKKDYAEYHMDAIGQFFNKNKADVSNVRINNLDVLITGKYVQGMLLSEGYNDYSNFNIGSGNVEVQLDYPYALNANQLRDSYINFGDNGILIKRRKATEFRTSNVTIKRGSHLQVVEYDSDAKNIYVA